MSGTEVVGYTYDGEFYCSIECGPEGMEADSDGVNVVFASDEWDYYPTCGGCGKLCEGVSLTNEGKDKLKQDQEM